MVQKLTDSLFLLQENRDSPAVTAGPEAEERMILLRSPPAPLPIIAIGASAGGLQAASKLLDAMTRAAAGPIGAAFIFVQHLDPKHQSLLAELLAEHTAMTVVEAIDGCLVAADHVYVIPPGRYLSVRAGNLHLSAPDAHHGARLPFDHLLKSLATNCGPRSVAVILSGAGGDGSASLAALRQAGGYVIAQSPEEAEYPGMPSSAIETGQVDQIVGLAQMPQALAARAQMINGLSPPMPGHQAVEEMGDQTSGMADILSFLKETTSQDFSQYKPGTIGRRIERRMGLLAVLPGDFAGYLDLLHHNPAERDLLAQDMLINVTSFFRDPKVFERLDKVIIPDLIENLHAGQALRIWVAGCSTGEEAYSIAMVCHDAIMATGRAIKLQIFASDLDADAIAFAREGLYSLDIVATVPAGRLARYFVKDEIGYRIAPSLRAFVVFTVQDVLTDPPFSRMDMVSCRNLLIYLNTEAQAKAISLFHFALREAGVLLLGSSETVGKTKGRFELISQGEKFYRHVARSRSGEPGFPFSFGETLPRLAEKGDDLLVAHRASLAEICGVAVLARHAPASVLINRQRQVVFSMGPTGRYLHIVPGYASLDLLAMAAPVMRAKLRLAIDKAEKVQGSVRTGQVRVRVDGGAIWFSIVVERLGDGDQDLLLVCFVDEAAPNADAASAGSRSETAHVAELERDVEAAQAELQAVIQRQEAATQEQKAINEEALSVNEEFQSTNEELLTSKEELQSLNEELTAVNSQLQETLDRQRLASDDLQNVLYSTNVATLFLDMDLKIRFFTPAAKALFNVIPGDIGRPLSDLASVAADRDLLADARKVLDGKPEIDGSIEREVNVPGDKWFLRRMFPYLTHSGRVEGVVITFADITERKQIDAALQFSKQDAERASLAKSRFLAAASHDLRQPLQSLTLIQDLLVQTVVGERPKKLLARFEKTLRAMSGMLNALLDINQIDAGVLHPKPVLFPMSDIFNRLQEEYSYVTQVRGLVFKVLPTSAMVDSDPNFLEQMIRNLLDNAAKYTDHGKILLGCRRNGQNLCIEVWDTGIGIAEDELQAIFEEFHQVGNTARERSRGLGLGLSIVRRLGQLLGHEVSVRSVLGKGSVFSITVPWRAGTGVALPQPVTVPKEGKLASPIVPKIMIVDDDPDVLDLLEQLLTFDGYCVYGAGDAPAAMRLVEDGAIRPEILLTDYNLPNGMNGLDLVGRLRAVLACNLPAIILTGDIGTETMAKIASEACVQLNKPVDPHELARTIKRLLGQEEPQSMPVVAIRSPQPAPADIVETGQVIYIVDDDPEIRSSLQELLEGRNYTARGFESAEAFLATYQLGGEECLLVDAHMPGMSGVELLAMLRNRGDHTPVILITGDGDVGLAVDAMRTGACDFIEKPVAAAELLVSISRALVQSHEVHMIEVAHADAAAQVAALTKRQREVMVMVLAGHPSKNIAADLGISQRTVENHRASIMHRLGVKSLPELARLVLMAEQTVAK